MDGDLKLFVRTLKGLNSNDKAVISSLAMMAKEARKDETVSGGIVEAAVKSISEASVNMKLPFFYVVDSIIKNVGSPYKEMFEKKIVDAFINTFQSNKDHKIRIKLYNLRLTWKNYFPSELMNDLDERVKKFDPAWPLVTKFDKAKLIESKKSEANLDKSSPDSTTPTNSRDPRINKVIQPEIKEERKRKIIVKEDNELFTIDRRGDNHITKVVSKKGRFEEEATKEDIPSEQLFGSKDVDLRIKVDKGVKDENWTSNGVFDMLNKKNDVGNVLKTADVVKACSPVKSSSNEFINTSVIHSNTITNMPLLAPREPTWRVIIDGFPQLPHIGTDPRLLGFCPFPDAISTITIDGSKYTLHLDRIQPCIFVNNALHAVRFFCQNIILNIDSIPFVLPINGFVHIKINRRFYIACLGGPGHELIINGWPYNVRIDGKVHQITVGGCIVNVQFQVNSPIQVNVQNAIPPYVCDWAVKQFFGSPQYINMPPLNPLRNQKLQDPEVNRFRDELRIFFRQPFQKPHVQLLPPPIQISTPQIPVTQLQPMRPIQQIQIPIPPQHQTLATDSRFDVNDLYQKLLLTGIIQPKKSVDLKVDISKYSWDLFSKRNDKEICDLYTGHQCDLCGTRFRNKDSKEFELHLDYHFYKNTTSLTTTRKSRDYIGGFRKWILGGSLRSNNPNFNFEETDCEQKFKCPKFEDDKLNKCAVCMEGFKVEWDDDEDSYMLQDCQLHNGKVYHPICFEDADKQIENPELRNEDCDTSQIIELTDQPLQALQKVLQGKSESVVLPDQSQRFSQEKINSNFQYDSVHS